MGDPGLSDDDLIRAFRHEGDRTALNGLIRRHVGWVRAMIYGMVLNDADADELSQEAFVRAIRGLPQFRGDARFSLNAVGATFTPEMAEGVKAHIARLVEATRAYQTGETYVNFMELDAASEDRVRAAYPPEDWNRLVALKTEHDPGNVFRFNRNIRPSSVAG